MALYKTRHQMLRLLVLGQDHLGILGTIVLAISVGDADQNNGWLIRRTLLPDPTIHHLSRCAG